MGEKAGGVTTEGKKAAIDLDVLGNQELSEISAADFLTALDTGGLALQDLEAWRKDKRAEYIVEPEDYRKVRFADILQVGKIAKLMRIIVFPEKKKYEGIRLEPMPELLSSRSAFEGQLSGLVKELEG